MKSATIEIDETTKVGKERGGGRRNECNGSNLNVYTFEFQQTTHMFSLCGFSCVVHSL